MLFRSHMWSTSLSAVHRARRNCGQLGTPCRGHTHTSHLNLSNIHMETCWPIHKGQRLKNKSDSTELQTCSFSASLHMCVRDLFECIYLCVRVTFLRLSHKNVYVCVLLTNSFSVLLKAFSHLRGATLFHVTLGKAVGALMAVMLLV